MNYSLCPWNSPSKNTGVDSHSLLQGIFPTQGSNLLSPALQADSIPSEPVKPSSRKVFLHSSHLCPLLYKPAGLLPRQLIGSVSHMHRCFSKWLPGHTHGAFSRTYFFIFCNMHGLRIFQFLVAFCSTVACFMDLFPLTFHCKQQGETKLCLHQFAQKSQLSIHVHYLKVLRSIQQNTVSQVLCYFITRVAFLPASNNVFHFITRVAFLPASNNVFFIPI